MFTFGECSNLEYIIISSKTETIVSSAFKECISLNTLYYAGSNSDWESINFLYESPSTTVYFYSEAEPALNADGTGYDGNYWYYDENGEPAIWTLTTTE